jgi:hypothetical protein
MEKETNAGNSTTIGFVRVRKRKLTGKTASVSYDLVRAVRVNGKPRHKFVMTLGSQKNTLQGCGLADFWMSFFLRKQRDRGLSKDQCWDIARKMIAKGARLPTLDSCKRYKETLPPNSVRTPGIDEAIAFIEARKRLRT